MKKLLILGHKRHGKDTFAQFIKDHMGGDFKFESSSMFCAEHFIFDALKEKYGYATVQDCFNDRGNHRAEWYDLISEYNQENPAKLAAEILKTSDCYVGMRSEREYRAAQSQRLFDVIAWVYNSTLPKEDESSFTIEFDPSCMVPVCNDYSLNTLRNEAIDFCEDFLK